MPLSHGWEARSVSASVPLSARGMDAAKAEAAKAGAAGAGVEVEQADVAEMEFEREQPRLCISQGPE